MPVLNIHSSHLIYGDDEVATANPKRVYVDWTRSVNNVAVDRPDSRSYVVDPGGVLTIFSGTRATSIDGTSQFALTLNPVKTDVYRLTGTAGTAPAFRTDRALNLNGLVVTVAVNNNATATFTLDPMASPDFAAVQVGDQLFVPGASTGDSASPFNPVNCGFWVVIAKTAKKLTLVRPVSQAFSAVAEAPTLTASVQLQAFSAAGVQIGDSLEVSAGFSTVTQKTFVVSAVTASRVEFTSTESLPLESGVIPTASGLTFYTDAKRFVRVEVDQDAVVRLNGDSGNTNRLAPRVVGTADQMGFFEKWGPTWQLTVVNRSTTASMTVNFISAE